MGKFELIRCTLFLLQLIFAVMSMIFTGFISILLFILVIILVLGELILCKCGKFDD